ncbi:hypothetical protein BJ322DRAFT_1069809 [Thelephora terrestris]|uniref:Uncharacterized protein n=1 Tax=Thelephora terrestris TaxID=56493 RepID=A0A9P6HCK6_9AGAM|nr:hypothetical protein BJ322DRAFT_1069809 [Thelephora terrestris]
MVVRALFLCSLAQIIPRSPRLFSVWLDWFRMVFRSDCETLNIMTRLPSDHTVMYQNSSYMASGRVDLILGQVGEACSP